MNTMNQALVLNAYKIGEKRFAMIPVSELRVDPTYQRTLRRRVLAMSSNWDYEQCDVLVVSFRDDVFYIIDGQHRYEAAKRNNVEYLPCQIYTGLTQREEAVKFIQSNTGVALLSPYDTYRANLFLGEPIDTTVKKVCDEFGVKILEAKSKEPSVFGSLANARKITKTHGESCLRWVLSTLCKAKWNTMRNGFSSAIVLVLTSQYCRNVEALDAVQDVIVSVLRQYDPRHIVAAAVSAYPRKSAQGAMSEFLDSKVEKALKSQEMA